MSIKKLFDKGKTSKVVSSTDLERLSEDIESSENLEQRFKDIDRFVPSVDFANPENFARFASAEKYYTDAMDRIVRYYPYDGSEAELNEFHNESSYIDKYIFDNLYPRTTGYAKFGRWGDTDTSPAAATLYYGEPTAKEYIEVKGGPHTASYGMPSGSLGSTFTGSNYYSTDIYNQAGKSPSGRDGTRESNLRMSLDDGITVEFWLKKESFIAAKTQKEVIFDLWNQVTSSDSRHGRLTIELTASSFAENGANPFRFTFVSGSVAGEDNNQGAGFQDLPLGGTTITTASVADNKWHHYALSVSKTGSNNTVRFYRDGEIVTTIATGSTTGEITGSLIGFIGALQTHPNLPIGTTIPADGMTGWGKLSGSIDEFRYWKVRRTSEEIKKNYYTQVRGGTNTDTANTELGVYYKFNEGVTGDSTLDSTVLDYSGRISNGTWVGYAAGSRSTGSAIVESSGSNKVEYRDPIIYPTHADVNTLRNNLVASASYHDVRNSSAIYHSMPSWIIEDDDENAGQLKNLTQVIGNYFDTLYLQIEAMKNIHVPTYQTSSGKALPFANRLLESKGFINSEIFANADVLEAVMNRDGEREFSDDLHNVKNLIYQNIYNNLVHIFKTKGTEKSFQNLIRSFGVDEELVRINLYADNTTQLLRDNFRPKAVKKNFIDFYQSDNQDAVVTHYVSSPSTTSADNPDSVGVTYISASHRDISTTAESEVIFPRLKEPGDAGYTEVAFTDSSIFGWDQADPDPDDYTKPSGGSGYQVLAIRPTNESKDAYFKLVDRANNVTIATSSLYKDVYDDQRWTFALRTRNVLTSSTGGGTGNPSSTHGHIGTHLTGGPGGPPQDLGVNTHVEVSLYGVHAAYDRIQEEFALSGNAIHSDITVPRRYYVGARRNNVTGETVNEKSSVRVGYLRHWQMYLDNKVIQAHARDTENYGTSNPMRSTYLLETPLTGVWMPEASALALNWDFSSVTGSDPSGEFIVQDFSSGSLLKRRFRDPDIDPIVNNQYNGRGYFFKTNTTAAVDTNYISSARYQLPEVMTSHDMIEIRNQDDLVFTKESRPISHYFAFEKSMYQTISEEMINMFAGITEFNNLIGEPVNRYRHEYKDMSKLRQIFYENVENTPDLDKYLSYYKWLDTALGEMLQQLVPASSRFSDDIRNVIEDTVLTRNKYRHILPTLRTPSTEVEGQIKGIHENIYNWRIGHAPMNNKGTKVVHPQPQNQNCLWWRHRAERMGASITSDTAPVNRSAAQVSIIDEQRELYKRKGYSFVSASVPQFAALQGTDGVTKVGVNNIPIYTGSYYPNNRFSRPYRLFVGLGFNSTSVIGAWNGQLQAGHNPATGPNTKYTYWRNSTDPADATKLIEVINIIDHTGCEDEDKLPIVGTFPSRKIRPGGIIQLAATSKASPTNKANNLPFSLYKSDATTGYKSSISNVNIVLNDGTTTAGGLELNNIHQDVIETGEASMQGPFTEKHVGGFAHRHVDLNTSLDNPTNRVEGFVVVPAADSIQVRAPSAASDDRGSSAPEVRADHYRNVKVKRPVNLGNIRQLTGSSQLNHIGNFTSFREVIQISDRDANNRSFVKHEGKGPFLENIRGRRKARGNLAEHATRAFAGLGEFKDVAKPNFYISGSSNKENSIISLGSNQFAESNTTDYTIIERFSAPGGPETAGDSMGGAALDFGSAQYSPYNNINYRNLSVRLPLRRLLTDHANQFGFKSDASTADQNAAEAAHDAYNPSTVSSFDYSGVPAFHNVNRNSTLRYENSGSRTAAETVIRTQTHDNYYVQREIPQSDTQYAWITASLTHIPGHQTTVLGHPHPDGMVSSSVAFDYGLAQGANTAIASTTKTVGPGFIPALNFVSASDVVSKIGLGGRRWLGPGGNVSHNTNGGADKRAVNSTFPNGFLPTDFVGMNGNVRQVINTGSLILSGAAHAFHTDLPQIGTAPFYRASHLYINSIEGSLSGEFTQITSEPRKSDTTVLNALNLNRNGPYGYPTWKQIRTGETRIGRYLRRNNIISYNETPGRQFVIEDSGRGRQEVLERFGKLRQFREPAVVSRYKPAKFTLGMEQTYMDEGVELTATRPVEIKASYGNNLSFFSNVELDAAKGFVKEAPIGYKTISNFYLRGGLNSPTTPVKSFINFSYGETLYPREENTYMRKSRTRNTFANNFWKDSFADRLALGQSKPKLNGTTADDIDLAAGASKFPDKQLKRSSWDLDGVPEDQMLTASVGVYNVLTGSETGLLQHRSAMIHYGIRTVMSASVMYARPHMLETTGSLRSFAGPDIPESGSASMILAGKPMGRMKIFGGITAWEAGKQAGVVNDDGEFVNRPTTPFYNSYEDYSEDIRAIAKDYSIVPEFRISEHIDFYVKNKQGDFLAQNPKLLSIFGSPTGSTVPQNSSEDEFFKVYSNSDFMKHFATVKNEHKEIANPSEITLTCKAAMKFLPYNGFYPSERTVEIATQFSKSYGSSMMFAGSDKNFQNACMRPMVQAMFAPGVLYNTIKSGLAVDYPIYTSSYTRHNPRDTGDSNVNTNYIMMATASSPRRDAGNKIAGWDYRVPFESLVEPERYLTNLPIVDMEVHPSSAMDLTASWSGQGDNLYKMMSSNFLAAVPEFFLPRGELTTIKSKPQRQFRSLETGSVYGMRIKLRKSYNRGRQPDRLNTYLVPQDTLPDCRSETAGTPSLRETFTMYSRPTAFGPPVSGRYMHIGGTHANRVHISDSLTGVNPSFTPPYYDGEAWCDVLFHPSSSFATLGDILAESKKIYWRFDKLAMGQVSNNLHPNGNVNINKFAMQLSSSFNLFQSVREPNVEYDKDGNIISVGSSEDANSVWVMQPKFETPMYNFADTGVHPITNAAGNLIIPTNNSESVTRGMWHQFGVIPTDPNKGIFLEIDDIPENFLKNRIPAYVSSSAYASTHAHDGNAASFNDSNYKGFYGGDPGSLSRKPFKSLLDVIQFDEKTVKLGQTAEKVRASEAIVAVPFIEDAGVRKFFNIDKALVDKVIQDPNTEEVGASIKQTIKNLDKFVVPPTMDFLAFRDKVDPIAMYFFDFEFEFNQDDLAHMWQNLMPPTGKIVKKSEVKVGHKLLLNELLGNAGSLTGEAIDNKLKWMVFKVKQRANMNYFSKVAGTDADADPRYRTSFQAGRTGESANPESKFSYNWPFDFFSMIEMVKLESEIKFAPQDQDIDSALIINTEVDSIAAGVTTSSTVQSNTGTTTTATTTVAATTSQPQSTATNNQIFNTNQIEEY